MNTKINPLWLIVAFVVAFALMKQCEGEPKIVTKTEVDIEWIKDSVKLATLRGVKPVYIDTVKTDIKWLKSEPKIIKKDSIIYLDKPNKNTIESKEYDITLESNQATTDLKIVADNLYSISGITTYPKETITNITTTTRDASGFYIYAQMPISSQLNTPELGVMFQIKNKLILGVGGNYNNITQNFNAVATIAVKL
ncbi:MAG: hypothetical protein WBF67_00795 [Olleya sp.]